MHAARPTDRWIAIFTLLVAIAYSALASGQTTAGEASPFPRLFVAALAVIPAHLLIYHAGRLIPRGWPSALLAQRAAYALVYGTTAERAARDIFGIRSVGLQLLAGLLAIVAVLAVARRWSLRRA